MKRIIFTYAVWAAMGLLQAQPAGSAAPTIQVPSAAQIPPADVSRNRENGSLPPGRAFNPTNPPPGRPFQFETNVPPQPMAATNPSVADQNQADFNQSGATSMATNQPAGSGYTNAAAARRINFSVTNTLSTMAPAQAKNVIQVQAGLNALQKVAIQIGGVQNVQEVIHQNPEVQEQLQEISTQISALAGGPVKPSAEIVQRLSFDLFRACSRGKLTPDSQLVLAVVINQACNCENFTPIQVASTVNNALAALENAGVPLAVAHPVSCDLHSIAFELQPNLGM